MTIEFDTKEDGSSRKFDRVPFLTFDLGQHLVRILGQPKKQYVHYVPASKATVKCLGDECPFCAVNKQLMMENPKDYNKKTGWNARQPRHYLNVLDRTLVKVCPSCGTENKKGVNGLYQSTCSQCQAFISGVEEKVSNKIKVANLSETNAELLKAHQKSVLNENGEPKGLENFDIMFMAVKSGDKKTITPIPVPQNDDKVEIPETALNNLDNVVLELGVEELKDLQRGVSLKDIFAARRPQAENVVEETETKALEEKHDMTKEEVMKMINQMFPNG